MHGWGCMVRGVVACVMCIGTIPGVGEHLEQASQSKCQQPIVSRYLLPPSHVVISRGLHPFRM